MEYFSECVVWQDKCIGIAFDFRLPFVRNLAVVSKCTQRQAPSDEHTLRPDVGCVTSVDCATSSSSFSAHVETSTRVGSQQGAVVCFRTKEVLVVQLGYRLELNRPGSANNHGRTKRHAVSGDSQEHLAEAIVRG